MNAIRIIGSTVLVTMDYDPEHVATLRGIAASAQVPRAYDVQTRTWRLPVTCADALAQAFGTFKWCDQFRRLMNGRQSKWAPAAAVVEQHAPTQAMDTGAMLKQLSEPLPDGRVPRKHQREAVLELIRERRRIVRHQMGTGKTLTALLAGKLLWEAEHLRTVVIARASLMENWRREAYGAGCRAVSVYSSAKIPTPPTDGYFLVADEAHDYQGGFTTQRGKKFLALASASQCRGVALLSGTPMKNGLPINLFPLLKAIKHPLGNDQRAYEARYCGMHRKTLGNARVDDVARRVSWRCRCTMDNRQPWTPRITSYRCDACGVPVTVRSFIVKDGATNTEELHKLIAPYMMTALKSECLDLPPKTRVMQDIEVSATAQASYDAALAEAKRRYKARVQAGEVSDQGEALALMTMVRMAASLAKVEPVTEIAHDIIEQGSKPVILTEFVETAKAIAQALGLRGAYHGQAQDRQALMDAFQRGDAPAFVGTRASAGTGHNLTAGDYVILHDRGLTPGDNDQAEDRLHRDGQQRNVTSIWPVAFSIDRTIDAMNERKRGVIGTVIDGTEAEASPRAVASEVMRALCGGAS